MYVENLQLMCCHFAWLFDSDRGSRSSPNLFSVSMSTVKFNVHSVYIAYIFVCCRSSFPCICYLRQFVSSLVKALT